MDEDIKEIKKRHMQLMNSTVYPEESSITNNIEPLRNTFNYDNNLNNVNNNIQTNLVPYMISLNPFPNVKDMTNIESLYMIKEINSKI